MPSARRRAVKKQRNAAKAAYIAKQALDLLSEQASDTEAKDQSSSDCEDQESSVIFEEGISDDSSSTTLTLHSLASTDIRTSQTTAGDQEPQPAETSIPLVLAPKVVSPEFTIVDDASSLIEFLDTIGESAIENNLVPDLYVDAEGGAGHGRNCPLNTIQVKIESMGRNWLLDLPHCTSKAVNMARKSIRAGKPPGSTNQKSPSPQSPQKASTNPRSPRSQRSGIPSSLADRPMSRIAISMAGTKIDLSSNAMKAILQEPNTTNDAALETSLAFSLDGQENFSALASPKYHIRSQSCPNSTPNEFAKANPNGPTRRRTEPVGSSLRATAPPFVFPFKSDFSPSATSFTAPSSIEAHFTPSASSFIPHFGVEPSFPFTYNSSSFGLGTFIEQKVGMDGEGESKKMEVSNLKFNMVDTEGKLQELLALFDAAQENVDDFYFDAEGGTGHGRHCSLNTLQIRCESDDSNWLVDFKALGSKVFDTPYYKGNKKRLRDIFHDRRILKVWHDIRGDSDSLYGHYKVHMQGVFDLQLLELAVRPPGAERVCRKSLENCLDALPMDRFPPEPRLAWTKRKNEGREACHGPKKYGVWDERPLLASLKHYGIKDVEQMPLLLKTYLRLANVDVGLLESVMKMSQVACDQSTRKDYVAPVGAAAKLAPMEFQLLTSLGGGGNGRGSGKKNHVA